MFSNVPQFIDKEDKLVGPLTAKQLGWLAVGGVILLITWNTLDMSSFIASAIIVGIIFGSLAFYRPYNQSLVSFLLSSIYFAFSPKVYIWKRNYDTMKVSHQAAVKEKKAVIKNKTIDSRKISELSKILDEQSR